MFINTNIQDIVFVSFLVLKSLITLMFCLACVYVELISELSSKLLIAILEYLTTLIMPRIVLEYTFVVAWIGGLINDLI